MPRNSRDMERVNLYIPKKSAALLRKYADMRGFTFSDVVRQALGAFVPRIAEYLQRHQAEELQDADNTGTISETPDPPEEDDAQNGHDIDDEQPG